MVFLILLALSAVGSGGVLLLIARSLERNRQSSAETTGGAAMAKSEGDEMQGLPVLHEKHPEIIPPVPHGLGALEFQGWFAETNRRIELWAIHHRSAADMALRIQLQKQINELQEEHLRYGRTQSQQLLLKHQHEAEIAKLNLQKLEAEDQVELIKERAAQRKNPPTPPPLPKTETLLEQLERSYRDEQTELKKHTDNPEMQEEVKKYHHDKRMKIKERMD